VSGKVTMDGPGRGEPREALAAVIAGEEDGLRRLAELLAPHLPAQVVPVAAVDPDRWMNSREAAEYAGVMSLGLV
jgi:hypothetical protein